MSRARRHGVLLAPLALLALVGAAVPSVRSPADAALADAASHGWHGAYDILVTGDKAKVGIDGLLPPNELSDQVDGIRPNQLVAVRAISGVDVAAPLGYAQLVEQSGFGFVTIPHDSAVVRAAKDAPTRYQLSVRFQADDGNGPRSIGTIDQTVVVDGDDLGGEAFAPAPYRAGDCAIDDVPISVADSKRYPQLFALLCDDGTAPRPGEVSIDGSSSSPLPNSELVTSAGDMLVQLPGLPSAATRLLLVDPEAEQKLLGSAGSFLAPLAAFGTHREVTSTRLSQWASDPSSSGVTASVAANIAMLAAQEENAAESAAPSPALFAELRAFESKHPEIADDLDSYVETATEYTPQNFVPMLYTQPDAKVTATVRVKAVPLAVGDGTLPDDGARHRVEAWSPDPLPGWTSQTVPADSAVDVFRTPTALPWPGTAPVPLGALDQALPAFDAALAVSPPRYEMQPSGGADAAATVLPSAYAAASMDYTFGGLGSVQEQSPKAAPLPGSEAAYFAQAASPPDDGTLVFGSELPDRWVKVGGVDADAVAAAARAGGDAPLGAYASLPNTVVTPKGAKAALGTSVFAQGLASSETTAVASVYSNLTPGFDAAVSSIRVRVADTDGYDEAGRQRVIRVAQAIDRVPGLHATIVVGSSQVPVKLTVAGYAYASVTDGGAQKTGTLGTTTQQWTKLGAAAAGRYAIPGGAWGLVWAAIAAVLALAVSLELAGIGSTKAGQGARMPRARAAGRGEARERASNPPLTPFGFGMRQLLAHGWRWLPAGLGALALGGFGQALRELHAAAALESGVLPSIAFVVAGVGTLTGLLLVAVGCRAALRGRRAVDRALVASGWTPGDRATALIGEFAVALVVVLLLALIAVAVTTGLTVWGVMGAVVVD